METVIGPIREHLAVGLLAVTCLGAVLTWMFRVAGEVAVRRILLFAVILSGVLSLLMVLAYQPEKRFANAESAVILGPFDRFQFRTTWNWVGETKLVSVEQTRPDGASRFVKVSAAWGPGIRLDVGLDGLSLWFVVLSVLLAGLAAVADWDSASARAPGWLWLQAGLITSFAALDVVLLVLGWLVTWLAAAWLMGQGIASDRREVTFRLVKTAWIGTWLSAIGLFGLVLIFAWLREVPVRPQTPIVFSIPELLNGLKQMTSSGNGLLFWRSVSASVFGLLMIGFTWPLMLAPFHRALLAGLNAAPAGVAMVVVGVAVKIGLYGWLRFLVPLFGDLLDHMSLLLMTAVSVFSLFAALLALGQTEWKARIALATSSSLGLCLLGILTMTLPGLTGGFLRALSHGLSLPLLIWLWGRAERHGVGSGSIQPLAIAGAESRTRSDRTTFRVAIAAAIGMPGFAGFVSDVLQPIGLFQHEFNIGVLSLFTSGLLAWMWVRAERDAPLESPPWTKRDWLVAGALLSANLGAGLFPQFVIDRVQPTLVLSLPVSLESGSDAAGQEP